jgi:NAD(P)-dependent dehydrogenase (short-subunit alcohol dehydrogenase family)
MNLQGKTALVTGSTDGVGRMVAARLAAAGATVLVHGRDAERGAALLGEIAEAGGAARFYRADLASLAQVRGLADAVLHDTPRLDIFVSNAGIGFGGPDSARELSADGHELRFAVNYLAGFLLTRKLLPLLRASVPARVVMVASAGQAPIDFADVMLTHGYSGVQAYRQSKLAQIMFTMDLAQELAGSGVTATCLHPATYMATTMVRLAGVTPWSTVEQGAEAILNLAAAPALEGRTGLYFDGLREAGPHAQAADPKARARLRVLSLQLAGLPADA